MIQPRTPNPEKLYCDVEVVEFMLETIANCALAVQQDALERWTSLAAMRKDVATSVRETQRILEEFRRDHKP